jgi:hypothetical protein
MVVASWCPADGAAQATGDTIEVYTVHDSPGERQMLAELREVLRGLDLRDWVTTRTIRIDETQIPHSHPVLTLHARHLGDPNGLLATFLHEQFHWWIDGHREALDAAIGELRTIFDDVPVGGSEGARSEYSSYLHLVVCHLEAQAMTLLRGEATARRILDANAHYTWIYDQVLNGEEVGDVLARHGLILH